MVRANTFEEKRNEKKFEITDFINCNSTYVIYRLECPCNCFYVELTKRRLHDRLAKHKYAIRTGNMNYPMAKHFIQAKHGTDSNLKVIGIEQVSLNIRGGDRLRWLKQQETFGYINWMLSHILVLMKILIFLSFCNC